MRRLCALLLVLMVLAAPWPAVAAGKELVVGVEELEYYPIYALRDGDYVGAAREILDAFGKDRGYRMIYRPLPIKRLFAELINGTIDVKFPDNAQWSGDIKQGTKVHYSQPVIAYVDGVMVRPANKGSGADSVRVLGTVAGFTPFAWLDRIKNGKTQLKENPRMELLLKQAAVGHIDGAYASVAVANYVLATSLAMPGAVVFDSDLPHSRDFYQLSSTRRADVIAEFDAWMVANQARIKFIKDSMGAERGIH
ncbi:MAG: transporter substrate-binding domain-containing protein [Alphaproteobacteria bacterium]|nr:transporter substrate-binding domain-containing protein [Alphaproteobacteria bacterium]